MRMDMRTRLFALLTVLHAFTATAADTATADFTHYGLFARAKKLVLPKVLQRFGPDFIGKEWDFSAPDRGNFTFFNNAVDVGYSEENDALHFTMKADTATLGWGNYDNRQAEAKRYRIWSSVRVRILARQRGCTRSEWRVRPYWRGRYETVRNQKRRKHYGVHETATLEGGDWQWLEFFLMSEHYGGGRGRSPLDAFSIDIQGTAGAGIDIREFQFGRDYFMGSFRKEFTVPEGRVWRAVADVGVETLLTINGQEVVQDKLDRPRPTPGDKVWDAQLTEKMDISGYLKPGANCVAITGASGNNNWPPNLYFRGTIVMEDGRRILVDTDETWRWTKNPGDGDEWRLAGFDDSGWDTPGNTQTDPNKVPTDNAQAVSWWRSHLMRPTDRPAYGGVMVLRNPSEPQLFYYDIAPVTFRVECPAGLAKASPVIDWTIVRYSSGTTEPVASGMIDVFKTQGGSIVSTLERDPLPAGVYLLQLTMRGEDGAVLETRIPEPFVVVGKVRMREVSGESYEQGMDLELEHDIDFTNPGAAYPTADTDGTGSRRNQPVRTKNTSALPPLVVERNGLTYRVTRPAWRSEFSTLVKSFEHPGDFYLGVLEYPDDKERAIALYLVSEMMLRENGECSLQKVGMGIQVGDKFPLTHRMRTARFLFRPDPGVHAFNILSLMGNVEAAASSLKLYHLSNGLPALRVPEGNRRHMGYLTESWNTSQREGWSNWYNAFKFNRTRLYARDWWFGQKDQEPAMVMCKFLEKWLDASSHYVKYLKFTGQNFHQMSVYMYNERNNPFVDPGEFDSSRLRHDMRELCSRVFNANGIDFMGSVEYCGSIALNARLEDENDLSWYLFDKRGETMKMGLFGINWNRAEVLDHMRKVARRTTFKFKHLPNFKGLNWMSFMLGDFQPAWRDHFKEYNRTDPLGVGYGDFTIGLFERETGAQLPAFSADNPDRFGIRHRLLTSDDRRAEWVDWRAGRLVDCMARLVEEMKMQRNDLQFLINLFVPPGQVCEYAFGGLSYREYCRQSGWDLEVLNGLPDTAVTQCGVATDYYLRLRHLNKTLIVPPFTGWKYPYCWLLNTSEDVYSAYRGGACRPMLIQHRWIEKHMFSWQLPAHSPSGDVWPRSYGRFEAHRPADVAGEVYTQALIAGDPDTLVYGFSDGGYTLGDEQHLRDLNRVFRRLPRQKFEPWGNTGLASNLAIRELREGGKLWIVVANPVFWRVQGDVRVTGADRIKELGGDKVIKPGKDGTAVLSLDLKPYGTAGFLADSDRAAVKSFAMHEPEASTPAMLRGMLDKVAALLAREELRETLVPEDIEFMENSVKAGENFLEKKEYAAVWAMLSNSRFWNLREQYLERQDQLIRHATEDTDGVSVDTSQRSLDAVRAEVPPVVDGKLDDAVWAKAVPQSGFMEKDAEAARVGTSVMTAYDEENLYVAFVCKDRFPEKVTGREEVGEKHLLTSGGDIIDMMLQPDPDEKVYFQMAFNFGGATFDQKVFRGGRDYSCAPGWETAALRTKDGWTAEVRIPVKDLGGKAGPGVTWGGNFYRIYRRGLVPYSMWTWHRGRSWHAPEEFGRIVMK